MKPRILLINPPIYDFSAYDFWLKPYGLLRVAGFLRDQADFQLFDYLNRLDLRVPPRRYRTDPWGRGEFYSEPAEKPHLFGGIRRQFRRFGIPRREFRHFINTQRAFDFAFIQTTMTYWYLGIEDVISDLRALSPQIKIILGGVYATLCPSHARSLRADLVVEGLDLQPLWRFVELPPNDDQLPLWDLYPQLQTGVLKLADGCPFRCTYCSVPQVYPRFHARPLDRALAELAFLIRRGAQHVAFYDDALLYQPEQILKPFLKAVLQRNLQTNFHTPNALNARFISRELAQLMIEAGFKNLYLGFESSAYAWQKKTGGKVYSDELARAVDHLLLAGVDPNCLHAYLIVGHPRSDEQNVEESMYFVNSLGIKIMLSEFSPIPGTPDGEYCRRWVGLAEPLWHNKTAFVIRLLGDTEINRLKNLAGRLNRQLETSNNKASAPLPLGAATPCQ